MQTRHRNTFTSIHTEGSLLPADLLQRVLSGDKALGGLVPADYHLPEGEKLNEAVNRSWNRLQGASAAFQTSKSRLKEGDPGTTLTRERWLLPLFQELGYGRLATTKAIEIEGKAYPISHGWANVPIHLVGCGIDLDRRAAGVAGASKSSPHSLVQELLNRADDRQWGIASNGLRLRILRDNASLTRQAYLEFDLEAMFAGEVYADFVLLWLFCHQSRFESPLPGGEGAGVRECWLEKWSKAAQERGTRALDQLRNGVEEAIKALGSGFLAHPANQDLRVKLRSGELDAQDYYRQLLRLVYRLIFLFAAEDRDLLLDPQAETASRDRYIRYYSTARLRRLAERQRGGRHADLWKGLLVVMNILGGGKLNHKDTKSTKDLKPDQENLVSFVPSWLSLGLPVLNGFLFSDKALPDLEASQVDNQSLLNAIRSLAFTVEGSSRRAVDYKNLGPEELGSVYESLLELHPILNSEAGTFELTSASGHERKTTGSYYTPTNLIQVLLDSALDPVIAQAVENAEKEWNHKDSKITKDSFKGENFVAFVSSWLLNLKVCDPACGSGHFLIAAAHRIARRLAQIQAGGDEPPPTALRSALRAVIAHCIYGVDVNPMAVELCKVNLWLESIEPGKPLSFLDAHIQCGDSLVGVGPGMNRKDAQGAKDSLNLKENLVSFVPSWFSVLEIPDEAFNPAFGDDKATAAALKKRNKRERGGQLGFRWQVTELTSAEDLARWRAERAGQVDAMPEDDPAQVQAKAQAFAEFQGTQEYIQNRLEYDLWTAAFFWCIPKGDAEHMLAPTQQELVMLRSGGELDSRLVEKVRQMAEHLKFFHWELAFPQVFSGDKPGFNVVLGNPPWDMVEFSENEYFAAPAPEIANAPTNRQREQLIAALKVENSVLFENYVEYKRTVYATRKFIQNSTRYPFSSEGRINLYPIFVELAPSLLSSNGRAGIIVPSAISMDAYNASLFGWLIENQLVQSLFDFENKYGIFPAVDSRYRFCLLTLSKAKESIREIQFCYFCRKVDELKDSSRRFVFRTEDIETFSPNTFAPPVLMNQEDAKLSQRIYSKFGVLLNKQKKQNPWKISIQRMLSLSDPGDYFRKYNELKAHELQSSQWTRLFSGKAIHQYNHRYSTYHANGWEDVGEKLLQDHNFVTETEYYVISNEVTKRLVDKSRSKWLLCYRDVTNATNERGVIATIIPVSGCDTTCRNIYFSDVEDTVVPCFLANINSIVFDYFARQKIIGMHLNASVFEQLPVLLPSAYTPAVIAFIAPRVLELVYTAYDLRPFAEDMGYHGEPFRWDEERRALLRAELDAYYARLYGLTRDELRYILDPQDVYGPDFPGETFRVLKDKENRQFGEYRTRRLVLEAWDRLEGVEPATLTPSPSPERGRGEHPVPPVRSAEPEAQAAPDKPAAVEASPAPSPRSKKEPSVPEAQPMLPYTLTDFGLYKCAACGKMVMGFEKDAHERKKHRSQKVEWKKLR